ncbi:putative nuclease HARBI1 [Venturia canescens]|uniref:putative nuclease HARBI1 n=1 Tax=Venturia canescens TaxID=32260 RepID=UPI001C9D4277|nr:putative nuclease HARBI1 [Venturia canescens]
MEDVESAVVQSLVLFNVLFKEDKNDDFDENDGNIYEKNIDECSNFFVRRMIKKRIPRLKNYVEEVIPSYSDEQFKSHYRMSRLTFNYILNLIKDSSTKSKSGRSMIPPERQFLIAIWKMATPDSYRSICEKFDPEGNRIEEVFRGFAATSDFPNVIGEIDGTHINIRVPHNNPECYVNRKGHHSIQLQAVCDHERRFTHCLSGHVDSVHDQRVFRLSEVNEYLNNSRKFPHDCHLVEDSAYTVHKHLMVPYRDNGHLTERQRNYNFCHASASITIERAFAMLKGRFRSLHTMLDVEKVDQIPDFIIACCVLHNICLLQSDKYVIEDSNSMENGNDIETQTTHRMERNSGYCKRDLRRYLPFFRKR